MLTLATPPAVELQVIDFPGQEGKPYQTLVISLQVPQITVEILPSLKLPESLDPSRGVILFERAPIWLYVYLSDRCRDFPWVAYFDVRSRCAVVISSRIAEYQPGDTIPLHFTTQPCPAILIGGPPNSGKSTLSYLLYQTLSREYPQMRFYLHRANWDGEGTHTHQNPDPELAKQLAKVSKYKLHQHPDREKLIPAYFNYHAQAIQNLRQVRDLVLVDVGGVPQPEKVPVVEQCTHSIIISHSVDAVAAWQALFRPLNPLAIIHSVLENQITVTQTEPYLELTAGKWDTKIMHRIPDVLLQTITQKFITS